jgi:hypothetical protein
MSAKEKVLRSRTIILAWTTCVIVLKTEVIVNLALTLSNSSMQGFAVDSEQQFVSSGPNKYDAIHMFYQVLLFNWAYSSFTFVEASQTSDERA